MSVHALLGSSALRPSSVFASSARGCSSSTILIGVMLALSLGACGGDVSAIVEGSRNDTAYVELGRQPARLCADVVATLPALPTEARYTSIFVTCGCIAARIKAQGRRLEEGDRVAGGVPVEVEAVFEPRPRVGEVIERITLDFRTTRGDTVYRRVRIRAELVQELVLAEAEEVRGDLLLPEKILQLSLPLRSAVASDAVRVEGSQWLHVCASHASSEASPPSLSLEAGPFTVPGSYDARVLLPVGLGCWEPVRVSVRVWAAETFTPGEVVAELPVGATAIYPVRLRGAVAPPLAARWEPKQATGKPRQHDASASNGVFSVDLSSSSADLSERSQRWELRVVSGDRPGLFEGRCLVRPRAEAAYEIPLAYAILVVGQPGDGPDGK